MQSRDFGIRSRLTQDSALEALWNARAARLEAEFTRNEVLGGRTEMPRQLWRPVAVLAENLAVAALRLEMIGLDNIAKTTGETLDELVAKYNAALDAYVDAERLAIARDWDELLARYGSVRREVVPRGAPGCLGVLAAIVAAAVLWG